MWELNSFWGNEVPSNPLASYHTTITHEVHVLLVDHERESIVSIANMLQMCSYKVTMVELASTALTMLANGGKQFDIVMANIHSPDYQGFKLLEAAVNREILTILMSVDEEVLLARRALECGAFLYIKKPVSIELVKYLWQPVVKGRLRNAAESTVGERTDSNGRSTDSEEESLDKENTHVEDDRKNRNKRKVRNQDGSNKDSMNYNHSGDVKRKACTEWTKELHAKFIDAVNQLGEGRCYPKDILERMNVPGLTRMQVASHLQKCRNYNWRTPEKRSRSQGPPPNADGPPKDSVRRFGTMPCLCINNQPQKPENQERSATLEINSGLGSKSSANGRGESSMSQFSLGCNSSVKNGAVQLQNLGILSGTSTEGIGIENEKSKGNDNRIPASVALEMTSHQPNGPNLPAFYGPARAVTNSQSHSPSQRQIADDFFEFPDMDYIAQNISELQQGSGINHVQNQQAYSFNQVYPEPVPMAMNMKERCLECGSKAAAP